MKSLIRAKIAAVAIALLSIDAYAQESPASVYAGAMLAGALELINTLRQLSLGAKIAILVSLAFGAAVIFMRTRDTLTNNMRKARNMHRKAVKLHERGKDEEAAKYYLLSSQLRQKAEHQ